MATAKPRPIPDTDWPCFACNGTGKNPNAHPSHNAECGGCWGSGLSTMPYHQRRNGTTITVELDPSITRPTPQEAEAAYRAQEQAMGDKPLLNLKFHSINRSPYGGNKWCCLISWDNRDYQPYDGRGEPIWLGGDRWAYRNLQTNEIAEIAA